VMILTVTHYSIKIGKIDDRSVVDLL
jgi:hypothetical protein